MNFFKSVFSDDLEEEERQPDLTSQPSSSSSSSPPNSAWSFGGLIKTITTKSETVLQTYKKDLEEFSTELKKETAVIRQVAARAVKDLPGSLEVGASVAQESLESVGHAIDNLGSMIITHGKDVLVSLDHQETANVDSSRRYSRFDLQIRALQGDIGTYVEEAEDLEEFHKWKTGFVLGEMDEVIDGLLTENVEMDRVYRRVVPEMIDDETFWGRYFYKVSKLKQVEEARASLVRRAIESDDEELSWDVDDDDEEGEGNAPRVEGEGETSNNNAGDKQEENNADREIVEEGVLEGDSDISEIIDKNATEVAEEMIVSDEKSDQVESSKDSDVSVVSTQPSLPEEQDLSWDEIEDLSSIDRTKESGSGSPDKDDLRKRLSMADDDEDLSWDIEDDD